MDLNYNKRKGTSGITGHLYESKLISLLLFRLTEDETVEEFYIASNMDGIGDLDDICVKVVLKGSNRNILLFIQAKHKESDKGHLAVPDNDLFKWATSINKIHDKFNTKKLQDKFFSGDLKDADYFLVLYTNAEYNFRKSVSNVEIKDKLKLVTKLNGWLSTNDKIGSLPNYTSKDVEEFATRLLKDELEMLAERFAMFLLKTNLTNIMNDYFIYKYHVVLAKKVVELSEVRSQSKDEGTTSPDPNNYRQLTFRSDFFFTIDENISFFREHLYSAILKHQSKVKMLQKQASKLTLSLILMDIKDNNGKYLFKKNTLSPLTSCEAKAVAAMTILIPLKVKVPHTFGNEDLVVNDDHRTEVLANYLKKLCEDASACGVFITKPINQGMLKLNRGLGSAIGNVLDYDEKTKQLKISDNPNLGDNAKALSSRLATVKDCNKYRFPVGTTKLPTLSLDCTDLAKEFLDKFLIYSQQSNHVDIQDIVEKFIQTSQSNSETPTVNSGTVFQCYHSLIQTWWMSEKRQYLTKSSDMYQQAIVELEAQMFAIKNIFWASKSNYLNLKFHEHGIQSLKKEIDSINIISKIVITTESISLTTQKIIQCLKTKYALIDLECYCTLSLTPDRYFVLNAELKRTHKLIVIACEKLYNVMNIEALLKDLADATEHKNVVFVVNKVFLDKLQQTIPKINKVFHDEPLLSDLASDSMNEVLYNANVLFHGERIKMNFLTKHKFILTNSIKGAVYEAIVNKIDINIGQQFEDAKFDKIKHLYIDREISKDESENSVGENNGEINGIDENDDNKRKQRYCLRDLTDLTQNVVLIIAKPGMGKSTLLTHLSLRQLHQQVHMVSHSQFHDIELRFRYEYKFKEKRMRLERAQDLFYWIVRINLVDYSNVFDKWQKNKTVPKSLETLEFLCGVVLNNHEKTIALGQTDDRVYLMTCTGDEWITFHLNVFLNFYNKGNVVFLFDGFDEICPRYKRDVIQFFDGVKSNLGQNKMWLTSRPYSDLLPDLIKVFGDPYTLEHVTYGDQDHYLNQFWRDNINFKELSDSQVQNTIDLMSDYHINSKCFYIFSSFLKYLKRHISPSSILNERNSREPNQAEKLTGSPLILYLTANYCVNVINNNSHSKINRSSFSDIHIYQMFIETKLKNILHEDKDKTDLTIQSNLTRYETDRKKCIKMHKMMAAYAILGNPIGSRQVTYFEEFEHLKIFKDKKKIIKFKATIAKINKGEEKTGLITHVTSDDIPVFIHRTFAEYFAAEFICDIFTNDAVELDIKRLLYATVVETHYGVKHWLQMNTGGNSVFNNITKEYIPFVYKGPLRNMLPKKMFIRLLSATPKDFESEYYNEEITNHFVKHVIFSDEDETEINKHIRNTIDGIVATMKDHLKQHFINY